MPLVVLIVRYLTEDDRWSEMRSAPMDPESARIEEIQLTLGYQVRRQRMATVDNRIVPRQWRCPGCLGGCGASCRRRAH